MLNTEVSQNVPFKSTRPLNASARSDYTANVGVDD